MFWLSTVLQSLFDYRLITINALIYNLIATEIVNANALIVTAVNSMTEFDKSATGQRVYTTTKISLQQQSDLDEVQTFTRGSTNATTKANKDQAELPFFSAKEDDKVEGYEDGEIGNNNIFSNNNFEFGNATTDKSFPIAPQTMNYVVVAASTAKPRPFDMMTDNCNRFDNGISIMPTTINERVDNFQNDKKQIASTSTRTTVVIVQQKRNAMTEGLTTPRTTPTPTTTNSSLETTATLLAQPTIKANVITAIKSLATPFTTITSTLASTATSSSTATATAFLLVTTTTATYAARTTTKKSIASITMSKMSAATTKSPSTITTTEVPHAPVWWPTLHGHDLLSSTNGTPNCRVTPPHYTNVSTEKSQDAANRKGSLSLTEALESSSAPPPSSMCCDKWGKIATTTNRTKLKSCSKTHVKSSIGRKRAKVMTAIKSSEKLTKSSSDKNHSKIVFNANTNNNSTKFITSALHRHSANAISSNTNATSVYSTITAPKSERTSALQTHWQRILSRRKRYLAFPEGSSFSVALCITVGIIGNPNYNYMSFGINWGVSYDLPNATWVLNQLHGLTRRPTPPAVLHRRSKRALYERIGETVDNMGYNGRDCVLRALCESRQYFTRNKMGMLGEMLRAVFSLPKQRLFTRELHESSDIAVYDHAYRKARETDCATQYQCSFSLLELAFGKYAKPPTEFYNNKFGM